MRKMMDKKKKKGLVSGEFKQIGKICKCNLFCYTNLLHLLLFEVKIYQVNIRVQQLTLT